MALIVQTIAGSSSADAYVSAAAFATYCENRNRSLDTYEDEAIEAAIRQATTYIDTRWRYKAITLVAEQSTEFPRDGLTDWNGRAVTGVPARVVNATCELAWAGLSQGIDFYEVLDRGGMIASESVGPISVSYAFNAPAGKLFQAAAQLLAPFIRSNQDAYPPFIGGSAGMPTTDEAPSEQSSLFTIGMMANNSD